MKEKFRDNPAYMTSEIALNKKGYFSVDDIYNDVKHQCRPQPTKEFVKKHLDLMCEYGWIGKTSMYYFSVND